MFDYQIKSAAAIAREAIVGGITQMKDRLLQLEAENAQLVAELEASQQRVAELEFENARVRQSRDAMFAEIAAELLEGGDK